MHETFFAAYDKLLAQWGPGIERRDIPTPYGTTRLNCLGSPDAPPLLLLPGGGETSVSWFANAPAWARTHRVLAADLIGDAGHSTPAPERPISTVADLHHWLDTLLDGLGIHQTTLAGHSYGAWIALHYALDSPRVHRLVLTDPTGCFAGYRPTYLLRALPMLIRPTPARTRSFLHWQSGGAPLDPAWLRLQKTAAALPKARPVTRPRPAAAALRTLRTPVLLLLAEHSRPHDARRVAATARRLLPHAEIAVLPGSSHHGLQHQAADELTTRVSTFIAT
ncbi:alpha/beta fold hydrolase [Streptomyces sp. CBMA152]|uniref:alpha/beta fold hydrolase n=1 Tax=Streptomyces sp. CBMA152 TaxID=1896312 RepID=UPI0016611D25|nr:alpha/beta hydrolase [Streptomyces sp. CBMA152]MBD0742163.1 carboxylesterase [Streptomyces sp. CBMA152]